MSDLAHTEAWFADAVMGTAAPRVDEIGQLLTKGPRLDAAARLDVYRHAYVARLVDCLREDYATVAHAMGCEAFEALAREYVDAHPSRGPNLNPFGRYMEGFLRARGEAFLAELARLEWAIVETIHAPAGARLALSDLESVPPDAWAAARFVPAESARVLWFDWPANEYLKAVFRDESPALPEPGRTATGICRDGLSVWRFDLEPLMARVLERLLAGDALGEALAVLEAEATDAAALERAAADVMISFRAWVSGGMFARIVVDHRVG